MISSSSLVLFLFSALGLLLIPGPTVIYIVTCSVANGKKAGLTSLMGIQVATLCHVSFAAFGLSAILLASSLAFNIMKYLGAAYLIYLGIKAILEKQDQQNLVNNSSPTLFQLFKKGFWVNLLNPKTALFFYAFLPQFVDIRLGSPIKQIIALGLLFILMATITDGTYAIISSGINGYITKKSGFKKIKKYISGIIYILLGVFAAFAIR